ncbi:MAG: DegT/DnrJ/EryC1/StrS family aminotransferase [Magnetococcales bacterium]|nr:DegT/DnrJ/EryC1/StrS family aminotransferase [Magnetococcales bacterium]
MSQTQGGRNIPLVDLKSQLRGLKSEIQAAMEGVLDNTDFIMGRELRLFEGEFAQYCGAGYGVGCASGTDALHLGLRGLGIGPGDEVIMPAMTFVATALGITLTGAKPVLVDVDPHTALIDLQKVEEAITPKTRAIIPVHLFGQLVDMEPLLDLARRNNLFVVEDAAQAHGATRGEQKAGAMGDVGCFSFYPGKNLGAYGDGGFVTTREPALAEKIRLLGNWGSKKKYHHEEMGLNSRLDTLQAAVLRVKLKHLESWNQLRREHARRYDARLAPLTGIQRTRYHAGSVHHLYVVRVIDREGALDALHQANIGAGIHYPFAVHELKAYQWLGYGPGSFPVAEAWARHSLSLPIYPELPVEAAQRVEEVLKAFS